MSLRGDAAKLSKALNQIVAGALRNRSEYATSLAYRISPIAERYDAALQAHSREGANSALGELRADMGELSGLVAHRLITLPGNSLDRYWELHTIFRESRYRDQSV